MSYQAGRNDRDPYAGVPEPRWTQQGSDEIPGPHIGMDTLALIVVAVCGVIGLGFVLYQWVW